MLDKYLVHSVAGVLLASARPVSSESGAAVVVVGTGRAKAATDWQSMGLGASGASVRHVPSTGYHLWLP